ncbi:MAG TPA: diacylglycerol kinase family protein [Burkholderiales bacterium]|nr:diacylglycerol kinase family protein [Burkholderiales bacterium]
MRITLIHNPGAGTGNGEEAGADALRDSLLALLRRAGHEVSPHPTDDGDWKAALEEGADLVAVAGGDGTVSRVAKAMAGRGIPVAPLPAGTANNIARTLGLVGRHWEEIVAGWPHARRVRLDVGQAIGPWGTRAFIEGAGAGLFPCLLEDAASEDRIEGASDEPAERVAAALELLRRQANACTPIELRAALDGKDVSGAYLLFEALVLPYVGPNLYLAPDTTLGDGTLDIVMVSEGERGRLRNYLEHWQDNRERLAVLPSRRGRCLRFEWTGFPFHVDDVLFPDPQAKIPERGSVELSIVDSVELLAPDPPQRKG